MNKLLIVPALFLTLAGAWGAETMCGESHVSFDGNQAASDDEFLYDTLTAYNSIKNRKDGGTVNGNVFECDNKHCKNNHVITMGPNHVFEEKVIPYAVQYRCSTVGPDRWIKQSIACQYRGTYIQENQWYMGADGKPAALTASECLQFDINTDRNGTAFNAKCEYVNQTLQMRCHSIAVKEKEDEKKDEPAPVKKTCKELRTTTNGKACCDLSSEVATYDAKSDSCVCAGGLKFEIQGGRGVCIAVPSDDQGGNAPFTCTPEMIAMLNGLLANEKTPADARVHIQRLLQLCKDGNVSQSEVNQILILINLTINNFQQEGTTPTPPPSSSDDASGSKVSAGARRQIASRISNSYSELEKLSNGFKVSKWKNEDGKFNGARLVSDSVAGVVLGTAGGLITSSVIKKNQVEDGFEDINCVVGGQVVAGWKDQFNVGVQ